MTAITTKYLGPTERRGGRIKATNGYKSVIISYPHHFDSARAHAQAALELCRRMEWTGQLVSGAIPTGYVFVWLPEHAPVIIGAGAVTITY